MSEINTASSEFRPDASGVDTASSGVNPASSDVNTAAPGELSRLWIAVSQARDDNRPSPGIAPEDHRAPQEKH
jgi:hypothetical protein